MGPPAAGERRGPSSTPAGSVNARHIVPTPVPLEQAALNIIVSDAPGARHARVGSRRPWYKHTLVPCMQLGSACTPALGTLHSLLVCLAGQVAQQGSVLQDHDRVLQDYGAQLIDLQGCARPSQSSTRIPLCSSGSCRPDSSSDSSTGRGPSWRPQLSQSQRQLQASSRQHGSGWSHVCLLAPRYGRAHM